MTDRDTIARYREKLIALLADHNLAEPGSELRMALDALLIDAMSEAHDDGHADARMDYDAEG